MILYLCKKNERKYHSFCIKRSSKFVTLGYDVENDIPLNEPDSGNREYISRNYRIIHTVTHVNFRLRSERVFYSIFFKHILFQNCLFIRLNKGNLEAMINSTSYFYQEIHRPFCYNTNFIQYKSRLDNRPLFNKRFFLYHVPRTNDSQT